MSKPQLPSVKGAAWLRHYKPSGICPPDAALLMLGLGALTGAATGAVGYYGGYATSFLGGLGFVLLVAIGRCGGCLGLIAGLIYGLLVIAVLGFGYPILLGGIVGYTIWLIAKKWKCRNPIWAGLIAFACGAVAYGIFAAMTLLLAGGIHETSYLTKLIELPSTSGWMYLIVAVDALLLIGTSALVAGSMVSDAPFCEECQTWYHKPVSRDYPIEIAEPLIRALETGFVEGPEMPTVSAQTFPRLYLSLQKCPCERGSFRLSTTLHWQETKVEKGQTKTEAKSEAWFTTMVSPDLGWKLDKVLFEASKAP